MLTDYFHSLRAWKQQYAPKQPGDCLLYTSEAWKRVKANKGSSGVDGVKIEDVEAMGIEKYLSEIKS